MEWVKKGETASGEDGDNDEDSEGGVGAEDEKTTKRGKVNQATSEALATIADNCDNVLAFLQVVAVKSPRVVAAPLSLRADNRARVYLRCWADINLPTLPKPDPQDHMGLTGVLTKVTTSFHAAEALCPVVTAQREEEKETKGWDCLQPTAHCIIMAASATTGTSILTFPPPTIHRFLIAFLEDVTVKSLRAIADPLSPHVDKHARIVPFLDRRQPLQDSDADPTRPPGSHGRPNRHGDPVSYRRSAPSCRR